MAKVLIVDDSDILRLKLRTALEASGHSVVEGASGVDGIKIARSDSGINLIITDLNMPEVDGIAMCQEIRKIAGYETIPIFMLTTEKSANLKSQGKEVGIKLWIVKPFAPERVTEAITKVLEKSKESA